MKKLGSVILILVVAAAFSSITFKLPRASAEPSWAVPGVYLTYAEYDNPAIEVGTFTLVQVDSQKGTWHFIATPQSNGWTWGEGCNGCAGSSDFTIPLNWEGKSGYPIPYFPPNWACANNLPLKRFVTPPNVLGRTDVFDVTGSTQLEGTVTLHYDEAAGILLLASVPSGWDKNLAYGLKADTVANWILKATNIQWPSTTPSCGGQGVVSNPGNNGSSEISSGIDLVGSFIESSLFLPLVILASIIGGIFTYYRQRARTPTKAVAPQRSVQLKSGPPQQGTGGGKGHWEDRWGQVVADGPELAHMWDPGARMSRGPYKWVTSEDERKLHPERFYIPPKSPPQPQPPPKQHPQQGFRYVPRSCPSCGAGNQSRKFCTKCGTKLEF